VRQHSIAPSSFRYALVYEYTFWILGVFCCLSILLDQIRNDGLVDVFQTVRHLREQRPHLIQTQDQYNFCYWSLLEHLSETQEVDL